MRSLFRFPGSLDLHELEHIEQGDVPSGSGSGESGSRDATRPKITTATAQAAPARCRFCQQSFK